MSEAERESQAAAEKAQKAQLAAQTEIDELLWLMSDKRGRRIVWRLLGESGVFRTSFSTDALAMAFAEGRRSRGLELMASVTQHCSDRYLDMQKEARTNERRKHRDGNE